MSGSGYLEFENEVKNVLFKVSAEGATGLLKGDRQWTHRIKELLGELGESHDFDISTGGFPDRFEPEWVCDLVLYRENKDGLLIRVPLIMESEWRRSLQFIKYDFEKLLMSNAELRLMICQAKPDQIEILQRYFKDAVSTYSHLNKGDRFLIAILDDYNSGDFIFSSIEK